MIRDVEINISRETAPLTQQGFGTPFILATDKVVPYAEYSDISSVAEDYAATDEAYKIAQRIFGQTPQPAVVAMAGIVYDALTETPADLVDALNEVHEQHSNWRYLTTDQQTLPEIKALSGWADAADKMYLVSTDDPTILDELASIRTIVLVHDEPLTYPAEGWAGACAPFDPGSITWKFKTVNGILPAQLGTTVINGIHAANGNSYVSKFGVNQTSEGKTTDGEYIDIIEGQDWVTARISEDLHRLLFTQGKIPFDASGISLVAAAIRSRLLQAVGMGIIATDDAGNPMFDVIVPRRSDIPANDRANRVLTGVGFEYTTAGAIHFISVAGRIVA